MRLGKRPRNGFSTVLLAGPARCCAWGLSSKDVGACYVGAGGGSLL